MSSETNKYDLGDLFGSGWLVNIEKIVLEFLSDIFYLIMLCYVIFFSSIIFINCKLQKATNFKFRDESQTPKVVRFRGVQIFTVEYAKLYPAN